MKSHLTLFSICGPNHLLFPIGLILFLLVGKFLLGYSFLQILNVEMLAESRKLGK